MSAPQLQHFFPYSTGAEEMHRRRTSDGSRAMPERRLSRCALGEKARCALTGALHIEFRSHLKRALLGYRPVRRNDGTKYAAWLVAKNYEVSSMKNRLVVFPRRDLTTLETCGVAGPADLSGGDGAGTAGYASSVPTTHREPNVSTRGVASRYLTIELRGRFRPSSANPIGRHVLGCDHFQTSVPQSPRAQEPRSANFEPRPMDRIRSFRQTGMLNLLRRPFPSVSRAVPLNGRMTGPLSERLHCAGTNSRCARRTLATKICARLAQLAAGATQMVQTCAMASTGSEPLPSSTGSRATCAAQRAR